MPASLARRIHDREIETRLILDSQFNGWTNRRKRDVEKNVNGEPWEFGSVSYEIDEFSRKFQNLIHRVR